MNNPRYSSSDLPRPSILFIKEHLGKNLIGVEIGTYRGENAESILNELDMEKLYLIDPYQLYDEWGGPSYQKFKLNKPETYYNIAKNKLSKWEDKVVFIKKFSENAVNDIPNDIDFIYIDGNHFLKYVYRDIVLYKDKVKRNGIISGHDYDQTGVYKAVNRNFKDIYNLKSDWWVIKE